MPGVCLRHIYELLCVSVGFDVRIRNQRIVCRELHRVFHLWGRSVCHGGILHNMPRGLRNLRPVLLWGARGGRLQQRGVRGLCLCEVRVGILL